MLSLEECATRLSVAYLERAQLNRTIWQSNQDLAARERALRPDSGWPGKNDEARSAGREAALAADQAIQNCVINRDAAQGKLAELEAEIAGVEAERRAAEWRIRERLVEALVRGGIDQQSRGDRMEASFDDTLQHEVDQAAADELEQAVAADDPFGPIEMPF